MSEVEKLRTRLKNVNRNVKEYRMTVAEAKALLKEIDDSKIPVEVVPEKVPVPTLQPVIMDGGIF